MSSSRKMVGAAAQRAGSSFEADAGLLFACTVPSDPRGKGSVRVGPNGHAYKDAKTGAYMSTCILFMRRAHQGAPLSGCLALTMDIYLRRPASLIPKVGPRVRTDQPPTGAFLATCKPDTSNVLKAVEDALTQAGVIGDDKLIASHVLHKWYVAVGDSPRVEVSISRMPGVGL